MIKVNEAKFISPKVEIKCSNKLYVDDFFIWSKPEKTCLREKTDTVTAFLFFYFALQLYIKAALDGKEDLPPLVWLEEIGTKKLENNLRKKCLRQ